MATDSRYPMDKNLGQAHDERQRKPIHIEILSGVPEKFGNDEAKKRTWGNKAFDFIIYPTIAFGAVFVFSVVATYQGKFGSGKIRSGYDGLTKWLAGNDPSVEKLGKAKSNAMVGVSFLAGTALIAPIKWFEDARDYWSEKLDKWKGTTPKNPADYVKEPKQSWISVLGGRVLTFAVVFGIAKTIGGHIDDYSRKLANIFSKENVATLEHAETASRKWKISFISAFEAFYTALCATGVYLLSRTIARWSNKKEEAHKIPENISAAPVAEETDTGAVQSAKDMPEWSKKTERKSHMAKAESYTAAVDKSRTDMGAQAI